jgi:short-subunit dehydrogenase
MPRLGERYSRALVTGAGSGLGKAFTEALIEEGVSVWGTSRNPENLERIENFTPIKLDLAKERNFKEWFDHWDKESGGFDVVINNAGFAGLGLLTDMTAADIDDQIRVLMSGPIQLARIALLYMGPREYGCLVNVSSVAGEMNIPFMSVYNSAKAGLSSFSQSLMVESPKNPPWIVDFRPGDFQTAFNKHIKRRLKEGTDCEQVLVEMERLMSKAPLARRAAEDLISSLKQIRHCTQYSGSFVQTSIASLASRLLPNSLKRKVLRRYYKIP